MFDIGFMELLLIGIVALLVLGPDKLPGAIRTGALWFGRAKRSFNSVKAEIEQQINTDDIRRQLHNESILGDIEKAKKKANKLIEDTQSEIKSTEDSVKRSIDVNDKQSAAAKTTATTSADEGVPTPPPENYQAPTKAAPVRDTTSTSEPADDKNASPSAETTPAPDDADAKPADSQDIYSTPPAGIVSMQDGKFSAVNDQPKKPDSSDGKK
jgi:sec-independent protein translocase protein TatB